MDFSIKLTKWIEEGKFIQARDAILKATAEEIKELHIDLIWAYRIIILLEHPEAMTSREFMDRCSAIIGGERNPWEKMQAVLARMRELCPEQPIPSPERGEAPRPRSFKAGRLHGKPSMDSDLKSPEPESSEVPKDPAISKELLPQPSEAEVVDMTAPDDSMESLQTSLDEIQKLLIEGKSKMEEMRQELDAVEQKLQSMEYPAEFLSHLRMALDDLITLGVKVFVGQNREAAEKYLHNKPWYRFFSRY